MLPVSQKASRGRQSREFHVGRYHRASRGDGEERVLSKERDGGGKRAYREAEGIGEQWKGWRTKNEYAVQAENSIIRTSQVAPDRTALLTSYLITGK